MTAAFFLDSNVVAHAASRAPADAAKASISRRLLLAEGAGISAQVLQEFFVVVTAKFKRPLSAAEADTFLDGLQRLPMAVTSPELVRTAVRLHERHRISYWDAAIIAAAKELAATMVYLEDLNHGQIHDGITVLNPFEPETRLPN